MRREEKTITMTTTMNRSVELTTLNGYVYPVDAERAVIEYSKGGDYKLIVGEGGFVCHQASRNRKGALQLPFTRIQTHVTAPSTRFDAGTLDRLWRERESTDQSVHVVVFDEARSALCAGTVDAWERKEEDGDGEDVVLRVRTRVNGRNDVRTCSLRECLLRGPAISRSDPLYQRWEREHAERVREGPKDQALRAHWEKRCRSRQKVKRSNGNDDGEDEDGKDEEEEEEEEKEEEQGGTLPRNATAAAAASFSPRQRQQQQQRRRCRPLSKVARREEEKEEEGPDNAATTRAAAEALAEMFAEVVECDRKALMIRMGATASL